MRVYKTRWFARWANKAGLSDKALLAAVEEMERGLTGDALGGFVFKKRIALPGGGKRGGSRSLVVYRRGILVFFMFGLEKNIRSNVSRKELIALKNMAKDLLSQSPESLNQAITVGKLIEISSDG